MQKPEWLMERLLLPFTDEKDEVLDLFMGTGTLGVVCKKYNRNYTGIEIDNTLFTKAGLRINRCDTPTNV
jgi:DNA modification methylase